MSFGTHGAAAIPDRLSVDYAPTGRASCKSCGAVIAQNTVRVGEKVQSPWHDGFDVNPPTHPLFRVVRRTRVRDGVGVWQRASYG